MPGWVRTDEPLHVALYHENIAVLGVKRTAHRSWAAEPADLEKLPNLAMLHVTGSSKEAVLIGTDYAALVELNEGRVRVMVGAKDPTVLERVLKDLEKLLPAATPKDATVPVTFWVFSHSHGPMARTRQLSVSQWDDIVGNYPEPARKELERLMNGFQPSRGGQLILWQGPPGTGKTHALRSLAWQWRSWADLHYVVDPDEMFGTHADYLLEVLMQADTHEGHWQVLVLEDTGELLAADAKVQTGQALSRLLNVVDGLIGQGLRVLVLVTTNDDIGTLHPAVARPGRCASRVEFGAFSREAAAEWLSACGAEGPARSQTLAELYAIAEGYAAKTSRRPVGFAS